MLDTLLSTSIASSKHTKKNRRARRISNLMEEPFRSIAVSQEKNAYRQSPRCKTVLG
nr:MAG TPA: hypothetical protein [Caudoviricetes sp.]